MDEFILPSLSPLELAAPMGIPRQRLGFTTWCLKRNNYITRADSGELAITAAGVEFVASEGPDNRAFYKLITGAMGGAQESEGARTGKRPRS